MVIEWDDMRGKSDVQREAAAQRSEARKQELLDQAYGAQSTTTTTPSGIPSAVQHKVCTRCGKKNPARFTFCGSCGRSLPTQSTG